MSDDALRLLRQDPRLAELADFPFDFSLARAEYGHGEPVRLASGGPLEIVAGDSAGGSYFVCGDGSVLYADSEGGAGVIGASVDEALEVVVGLPGWRDCLGLSPADGEEKILARVAEVEDEMREDFDLDADRAALRAALGLPERSPVELVGILRAALLRTEPDFLLLNAEEGGAYELLGPPPPPLWERVLAAGRADLAALRAGEDAVWEAVTEDAVRRRLTLRAAQFDRVEGGAVGVEGDTDDTEGGTFGAEGGAADAKSESTGAESGADRAEGDLALLRRLLRLEARSSMTDELRLAAVLVGLYGRAEDLPLLDEIRRTDFDTGCGLGEIPRPGADPRELREWARETDELLFGADPADEPLYTWTDLALDQGLTTLALVALIRRFDAIELDQSQLRRADDPTRLDTSELEVLAEDFERLGEPEQALRARRLHSALR